LFVFAARLRLTLAAFAFRFLAMTYLLPGQAIFQAIARWPILRPELYGKASRLESPEILSGRVAASL
jgi:hypothetical protein